jgi:hypothetical protein
LKWWSQAKVRSTTQAGATEAGAVLALAAGDLGFDPELPEQAAVLVVVVALGLRRG